MIILGIDTSCDDTSAALLEDGKKILSNVVHSQIKLHHPYGGVVPELASREHLKNIMTVVRESLREAGIKMGAIDGIAVTVGPGLVGSLLIGLYYSKAVAFVHGIPLMAINHLEGHILSIFLEDEVPVFPFVALTVSGGHTSLYHVKGYGSYTLLGQTLDDAAGEAFDKVAKMLGLGYPGGEAIEKLGQNGSADKVNFPRAYMRKESLDFSFSGLKTAVSLYIKKWRDSKTLSSDVTVADIAASFQEAVVDVLVTKVMSARKKVNSPAAVVTGGVACNNRLRAKLMLAATEKDIPVYFPRPCFCTDNGAMIALAGYHRFLNGESAPLSMDVRSRFPISDLSPIY